MKIKPCIALSPTPSEFAPLYFAGNLSKGFEVALALGFKGVELNLKNSEELNQAEILEWSEAYNLPVVSIGTGQSYFADGLSISDVRVEVQEKVRERLKGHIRFASKLKAQVVLGSIRGKLDDSSLKSKRAGYKVAVDAVKELADFAADMDVKLTVEPINRYETNFINTAMDAVDFVTHVNADNVGIVIDTFHMNIEEQDFVESIYFVGERLWHCHLVDSNRYALGMGHIDFVKICHALEGIGYEGYVSAEVVPIPDDMTSAKTWIETFYKLVQK